MDLLLGHPGTRREGLSEREAPRRLGRYEPNEIRLQETTGHLGSLVRQFSHPLALLLRGVPFELVFAAAVIYLPPLQTLFGTATLGLPELAMLAAFLVGAWGTDDLLPRACEHRHGFEREGNSQRRTRRAQGLGGRPGVEGY